MCPVLQQDNSSELESLQKQAEEVIAKARAEASAEVQAAKKETEKEIEEAADAKKKVRAVLCLVVIDLRRRNSEVATDEF